MKVSLKLEDQPKIQNPLLLRVKIPITVYGLPFLSAVTATHHHHSAATASDKLSLSLRTHFPSGPSLKLSYNTPTTAAVTAAAPFTLTLKSGVSLSGSPVNSPLIMSANFSFSPQNPNPNPSFSLQFKPRIGSFSLRKSVSSSQESNASKKLNGGGTDGSDNSYGFVPLERPINWKELTMESATKGSILSGFLVMANTELPVTKRVKMNFRWGVSFPSSNHENPLPYLRANKIKFERTNDVKEDKSVWEKEKEKEGDSSELEMLKSMYSWMSREWSDLHRENREMMHTLEEMRSGRTVRSYRSGIAGGGGGKKIVPVVENLDGFEQWRAKQNGGGEQNAHRETKKNVSSTTDVESELQKAIKAASS